MLTHTISRREMLQRSSAMASITATHAMMPTWMPKLAFSPKYQAAHGDILVCVFLRGGADGLNMVVPHGEQSYYDARPQLAIPRPDDNNAAARSVDIDGFFGLHPTLAPLMPMMQAGQLVAVHASGSPDPTRSHFEAMDFMERGTPGSHNLSSGWIGRHLSSLDTGNFSPVRAIGWGTAVQKSLRGQVSSVALKSIIDYHLGGREDAAQEILNSLNSLYALDTDSLHSAAQSTQSAIDVLQSVDVVNYQPHNGAAYPDDDFAYGLLQTAALIRADVGLEVAACLDLGGWDTHVNQGALEGDHANLMAQLATGLTAFHQDMGPDMQRITVVVMSEFGRRVEENANLGTDHGHGNVMFVMSGNLNAAPVHTISPGLHPDLLDKGDLAITIDYRDVLTELLQLRLGNPSTEIFPNYTPQAVGIFGAAV